MVAKEMAHINVGMFFIMPVFSKRASAPTKLGEFLGCGVPCLGNDGVGDMTQILESENLGVIIKGFDDDGREKAIDALLSLCADPNVGQRCIRAARKYFSLDDGVSNYNRIYRELAGNDTADQAFNTLYGNRKPNWPTADR